MIKIEKTVEKTDKLLNFISQEIDEISFSQANSILRKKDIRVNGEKVSDNIYVVQGDNVTLFVKEENFVKPTYYSVIFEDSNIIVVNKKAGLEVSSKTQDKTLEKELAKDKKIKLFSVHRLDRNTEGVVMFAKSKSVQEQLVSAMKNEEITKIYMAEVVGDFNVNKTFTAYLQKDSEEAEVKIFDRPMKGSIKIDTKINTIKANSGTSLLMIEIHNGKTHQIRAHLAHMGHAIVGDGKYGKNEDNKKFKQKTQKLSAVGLVFGISNSQLSYLNNKTIKITPSWLIRCV